MKKALTLFLLSFVYFQGHSQALTPYQTSWIKVDTLEKQGLYRSAWSEAHAIFTRASAAHDTQQQLKALIYELKYRGKIEENADPVNIQQLDSVMRTVSGTGKAILQSMLAEAYGQYANANRYRLYGRLPSSGEREDDITTWSLQHLYEHMDSLYQASVADPDASGKIRLRALHVIVDTGNSLRLTPTLYDLLARRAIAFYEGPETGLVRPADQFTIRRPEAFADAADFTRIHFQTRDSGSWTLKGLRLYQALISFHLKDRDPAALRDADLSRLQFVYHHAVMANKDTLYRDALRQLIASASMRSLSAKASYLLASWYFTQGSSYDPFTHPQGRYDLKTALAVLRTIPLRPVDEASVSARGLKASILRSDLDLTAEQVNLPGKPFRVLVRYKNARHLYLRLVKLPDNPRAVSVRPALKAEELLGKPVFRAWQDTLPDTHDYQHHSVEIGVGGVPPGRYALIASGSPDFGTGTSPVVSAIVYASAISYVDNGRGDFLVVDRSTGQPLEGARVHFWKTVYNYTSRRRSLESAGVYVTDGQGYVRVDNSRLSRALLAEISWEKDHLYTGQTQYIPWVRSGEQDQDSVTHKALLFTDRSIYRPGQTLYFKGIYLRTSTDTHNSHVMAARKATVYLIDANGQRTDSLSVTTNGFGSYWGSFVLNKGQLLGSMRLETADQTGNAYFSVEDYKRPTFYLKWDTANLAYRLGDTIPVTGEVTSYSQAPIGGATVSYSVTRRTRIRFPYYRTAYPSQVATIAQGTTTTDETGNFRFAFPALPDPTMDTAALPVYIYALSVTVTDITGESHAFDQEIPLGYRSMELSLDLPASSDIDDLDSLRLSSRELSGRFIPAHVALQLIPVKAPERYIRDRYWNEPDQHILSTDAYLGMFPHDEYAHESDPGSWKKAAPLWTGSVTTNAEGIVPIHTPTLKPGWYQVLAVATDKDGLPDTATAYIQLYDTRAKQPAFRDPLWTSTTTVDALPGQQVHWSIGSGTGAYIISQSENPETDGDIEATRLGAELRPVDLRVAPSDRGGIVMHYVTVRYNRIFTRDVHVQVPWKDKQLHISYETFRDKLLPGARESWRVKISGPSQQKVRAEMLASMYDASLDAFKPHDWPDPSLYPTVGSLIRWSGGQNFTDIGSGVLVSPKSPTLPSYSRIDPTLKWFGYRLASPPIRYMRGTVLAMATGVKKKLVGAAQLDEARVPAPTPEADTATNAAASPVPESPVVRTIFNETAFFLPQLETDDSSGITFSFTMPEALTRWKMMLFAHTRDMQYAFSEKEVVTQKKLMIQASFPRFVRQGDQLTLGAKVNNLTSGQFTGTASLQLYDLVTGNTVDAQLANTAPSRSFQVDAGGASVVSWKLKVPDTYSGALGYRVTATTGNLSDGEQNALPVLSNRTLVTESLPLHFRGSGTRHLTWDALTDMGSSDTRQPQALTVEYASNPVWYAVLALPFMDEELQGKPNASALFNRYYANALSTTVAKSVPGFDRTMEAWVQADSSALKSPLEQNESLKSVLLEETPWVAAAEAESDQRARVAYWFTDGGSHLRLSESMETLSGLQLSNGGFTWFKGMPDDRFITNQIITGIGHLRKLGAWPASDTLTLRRMAARGVAFLDSRTREDYTRMLRLKPPQKPGLGTATIHYLYMRSFFPELTMEDSIRTTYQYYLTLAAKEWTRQSPYNEAMIALALYRSGDQATATAILKSLKERAIADPVKGMHWKESVSTGPWSGAPGETQALLIEAFHEIGNDPATLSDLCTWLLSQKRTHLWPNGNSTADAVFALLISGRNWIKTNPEVSISLGNTPLISAKESAGAGYQRMTIPAADIKPGMGKISVEVKNATPDQPSWGAVYFQYLEQMNKVGENKAPLSVNRQISLEQTTASGKKLVPVSNAQSLKVGDKVQVRMTVKVDEDLDYVHLKDVRASCMEPLQVLSGYHWENGTGFYKTVTDAAVHFYFSRLSKGTYVFTYPVYITQAGTFTGGLTTLQCLYAPEFTAHSSGVNLKVSALK